LLKLGLNITTPLFYLQVFFIFFQSFFGLHFSALF